MIAVFTSQVNVGKHVLLFVITTGLSVVVEVDVVEKVDAFGAFVEVIFNSDWDSSAIQKELCEIA